MRVSKQTIKLKGKSYHVTKLPNLRKAKAVFESGSQVFMADHKLVANERNPILLPVKDFVRGLEGLDGKIRFYTMERSVT